MAAAVVAQATTADSTEAEPSSEWGLNGDGDDDDHDDDGRVWQRARGRDSVTADRAQTTVLRWSAAQKRRRAAGLWGLGGSECGRCALGSTGPLAEEGGSVSGGRRGCTASLDRCGGAGDTPGREGAGALGRVCGWSRKQEATQAKGGRKTSASKPREQLYTRTCGRDRKNEVEGWSRIKTKKGACRGRRQNHISRCVYFGGPAHVPRWGPLAPLDVNQ